MSQFKIFLQFTFIAQFIFVQNVLAQEKRQLISNISISPKYLDAEKLATPILQKKLNLLRTEGVQKKWTFQVVATDVATMNLKDITGAEPPNAQTHASGISQNNQPPPLGNNIANANARSFDLRALNLVSPVRSQFSCGSCWAMASIASLETSHILKNKISPSAIDLSEEQVVNCSGAGTCGGGGISKALEYLKNNNAAEETNYPYTAANATCRNTLVSPIKAYNWGWVGNTNRQTPSISEVKNAIVKFAGVATWIWVNNAFQMYGSGVFNDQTVLNNNVRNPASANEGGHFVQIIGWNDDLNAWLVKNSWGTRWGMNGFGWIDYNVCDIGSWATWVVANEITPVNKTIPLPTSGNRLISGYFSWSHFSVAYPTGKHPNEVFDISVLAPQSKSGKYIGSFPVSSQTFGQSLEINPQIIMDEPTEQPSANPMQKSTALRVNFTIKNLPENMPLTIIPELIGKLAPGIKATISKPSNQNESNFSVYIDGDFKSPVSNEIKNLAFLVKHTFADTKRIFVKEQIIPLQKEIISKPPQESVIIKPSNSTIKNIKKIKQ